MLLKVVLVDVVHGVTVDLVVVAVALLNFLVVLVTLWVLAAAEAAAVTVVETMVVLSLTHVGLVALVLDQHKDFMQLLLSVSLEEMQVVLLVAPLVAVAAVAAVLVLMVVVTVVLVVLQVLDTLTLVLDQVVLQVDLL